MKYVLLIFCISLASCGQATAPIATPLLQTETKIETGSVTESTVETNAPIENDKLDKGHGFTLEQNAEESILLYSAKPVISWSHMPPVNVPFLGGDACPILAAKFQEIPAGEQSFAKQRAWESMNRDEQKNCIREALQVTVEPYNGRFYKIERSYRDTFDLWLFDSNSLHIQRFGTGGLGDIIKKVTLTASGIDITAGSLDGATPDMNVTFDASFSEILSRDETETNQ